MVWTPSASCLHSSGSWLCLMLPTSKPCLIFLLHTQTWHRSWNEHRKCSYQPSYHDPCLLSSSSLSMQSSQSAPTPQTADAEPPFPGRRVEFYGFQADWSTKALLNLKLLVDIQSAIDFFVQDFVRKQCYPDKGQYSQPPTRTELVRIHRALWRFELCCELYRSPTSNGGFIEYGRLSSTRLNRPYNYLRTLTP